MRAKIRAQRNQNAATKRSSARGKATAGKDRASQMRELGAKRREAEARRDRDREQRQGGSDDDDDEGGEEEEERAGAPSADVRRREPAASADPMEGFGGEGAGFEAAADPPTLERIRLTRNKLELWLLEPFFERVLPGCLVRIGIGQQSSGRPVYKVAEVLGVKDGFKPYMMGKAKTTKRLELAIGSAKKAFAMNFVSNQNFEVQELEKYRRSLKEAGGVDRWPSQRAVDQKAEELRKCKDYDYTEEEINAMVAEKKKLGLTKGRAAADKATLAMDLLAAREGDEETRKQLEAEQKKLEARQASEKRLQEQREGKAFAIKDINMRNRAFELTVARTAGERAKAQRAGDAPSVKDPFARIENRGTNYYTIGKAAEPATAAAEGAGPSSAAPSAPELAIDVSAPAEPHADSGISPGFRELIATPRPGSNAELPPAERAVADIAAAGFGDLALSAPSPRVGGGRAGGAAAGRLPELIGRRAKAHAVDIDIDIDIDAPVASVPRLPTVVRGAPPLQPPSDAPRNTLSVSDYKRRMGIL